MASLLRWAVALSLLLGGADAFAKSKKDESGEPTDLDRMTLAKVMLGDNYYDRALSVLLQVDPASEGVDPIEYWRLLGLSNYKLSQWESANKAYTEAMALGDVTPLVFLQRADALRQLKRGPLALTVLKSAPPVTLTQPGRYILESKIHHEMGNKHDAFLAIDRGHAALPDAAGIARTRIRQLVELGLYQFAVDEAQVFFQREDTTPDDYIALATALVNANEKQRAALLLEQAALLFPEDIEVRSRLALAYYEKERPLSAGDILYPLALINAESAQSAAELYVKAGRYSRAVRMNARIEDQAVKVRQRLIILLEQSHYEAAASLDKRIERLGLLEDENILYALAYAHYRTGNFTRMERLLSLISDASLFRKSIELRRSAEKCRQSFWKCD